MKCFGTSLHNLIMVESIVVKNVKSIITELTLVLASLLYKLWVIYNMGISDYYESTARQRKWGTWCIECKKEIERGDKCMRRQHGYNSNNCMEYTEYCMKCYNEVYQRELKKEAEYVAKEIESKQKILEEIKNKVII